MSEKNPLPFAKTQSKAMLLWEIGRASCRERVS